jgi:hypothetical protein
MGESMTGGKRQKRIVSGVDAELLRRYVPQCAKKLTDARIHADELDICGLNTNSAHFRLMKYLRDAHMLGADFLYRGTDTQELCLMAGLKIPDAARNIQFADPNSVDCYTAEQMAIKESGDPDAWSPVWYAQTSSEKSDTHSLIIVYRAAQLRRPDESRECARSEWVYMFKTPEKLGAVEKTVFLKDELNGRL